MHETSASTTPTYLYLSLLIPLHFSFSEPPLLTFLFSSLKLIHLCRSNLWWNLICLTVPSLSYLTRWSLSKLITPATITLTYVYFFTSLSFSLTFLLTFLSSYIFTIISSISSVTELYKNSFSPPGSKQVRLCLACQAVKNMFTSGGRSYSVPISSLTRRNLPCT